MSVGSRPKSGDERSLEGYRVARDLLCSIDAIDDAPRRGELDGRRWPLAGQVAGKPFPGEPAFRHPEDHYLPRDSGLQRAIIV
jgi:hypothetical protein